MQEPGTERVKNNQTVITDVGVFVTFIKINVDIYTYLQVRANPPIRFAEWSGDKKPILHG